MAEREYHRKYWQSYKAKKRQISMTLSPDEYRAWEKTANKNGVKIGQQIKAEALAYREQERVPDSEVLAKLNDMIRILRGIGNNLNQMARHSNMFRRVLSQRQTIDQLAKLEHAADRFVRNNQSSSDEPETSEQ